jgi:hypothetical protein
MAEERKLSHKKQSDNSHHSNDAMDILGRYNNQGRAYLLQYFTPGINMIDFQDWSLGLLSIFHEN